MTGQGYTLLNLSPLQIEQTYFLLWTVNFLTGEDVLYVDSSEIHPKLSKLYRYEGLFESFGSPVSVNTAGLILVYMQGSVICKEAGLTEDQSREVVTDICVDIFGALKKSITLARTKALQSQENLDLIVALFILGTFLVEANLPELIHGEKSEMIDHLMRYLSYLIEKHMVPGLVKCTWAFSLRKYLTRIIQLDLSRWKHEILSDYSDDHMMGCAYEIKRELGEVIPRNWSAAEPADCPEEDPQKNSQGEPAKKLKSLLSRYYTTPCSPI